MANTKHNDFVKAVTDWLTSDATLKTLTGHSTNDLRIFFHDEALEDFPAPSLMLLHEFSIPLIPEIDNTFYESEITCEARALNAADSLTILGQVEEIAKQTVTQEDASFDDANVTSLGVKFQGPANRPATLDGGTTNVFLASGVMRIIWRVT